MGDFETVNDLSILIGARRPQWVAQVDQGVPPYPNGAPDVGGGVFLQNSPKTLIAIDVREQPGRRSGRVTLPIFDLASTYTVDIDGNPNAVAATVDVPTTIAAMAAAITADTPAGAGDIVTATAIESDPGVSGIDTLLLRGTLEADWIATLSVAGGTGTILGTLDRDSTKARVWFTGKTPNAPGATSPGGAGTFRLARGAAYDIDRRGFAERFDTSGLDRCYVELHTLTNPADVAGASATIAYSGPAITLGPSVRGSGE